MGEALYRKYRPKQLADVVGQPHITTTLHNALKKGLVSHGYLFSGPRGVGKTSIARILAYEVNSLKYADTKGSLDIIEIDAASNRRIDEIREIRDKVHAAPVMGKYKVYIIDEVHMLTREAFNALLKTLEEPPAHVIFILATTEVHKVPETIISRTQRFTFKPIKSKDVSNHLKQLASQEDIKVADDALELIAKHGEGSFRDSIGLLDQLAASGDVTIQTVQSALGIPSEDLIKNIIEATQAGKLKQLMEALNSAEQQGYHPNQIAKSATKHLRQRVIHNDLPLGIDTLRLMSALLQTANSPYPREHLELSLMEFCINNSNQSKTQLTTEPKAPSVKKTSLLKTTQTSSEAIQAPPKSQSTPKTSTDPVQTNTSFTLESWEQVLVALKETNNTLYGIARIAKPEVNDEGITLKVPFKFHHRRLTDEKNAILIRKIVSDISGQSVEVSVLVDESLANPSKKPAAKQTISSSDTLESITQIFGGGEVLDT